MAIVHIGLSCYDQFFFVEKTPAENVKTFTTAFMESGGGPAGNAAFVTGKWGAPTYILTTLRNDIYGEKLISEHQAVGVNTDHVVINERQVSPLSAVVVSAQTAARTIVTHKNNGAKTFTGADYAKLDELIDKLNASDEKHIILVDGHELEISEYFIPRVNNRYVVLDADAVKEPVMKLLPLVDFCVSSEEFAEGLIGEPLTSNNFALALEKIRSLCAEGNCPVVTLGERGGIYLSNNQMTAYPAYDVKAVDTTGAGDIFHGAFCYGVAAGWDLSKVVQISALTSAIKIQQQGVRNAIPELDAVLNAFENKLIPLKTIQAINE
ncbi:carbohydrate kinase family protein [Psittacicella hinzii]|nr:PfkB family carbohydrate kinase [Psittacicella hinzii]